MKKRFSYMQAHDERLSRGGTRKHFNRSLHTESLTSRMTYKEKTQPGNVSSRESVRQSSYDARNSALALQLEQTRGLIYHLDETGLSWQKHSIEFVVRSQPGYHTHRLLSNEFLGAFGQIRCLFLVKSCSTLVGPPPCSCQALSHRKGCLRIHAIPFSSLNSSRLFLLPSHTPQFVRVCSSILRSPGRSFVSMRSPLSNYKRICGDGPEVGARQYRRCSKSSPA